MKLYYLKCYLCGKKHEETESITDCTKCDWPLETYYDYDSIFQKLNRYTLKTAPISALKYSAFYPINDFNNIVSLEEWGTPLIHAKRLWNILWLKELYIKNEWMNPTWCFKDRWTLVEVTKAKELWSKAICVASTWNMAASVAAYSSANWIPCYVLVPEWTPIWKLAQTLSFWARIIQIRASYSRCAELAVTMAKKFWYYLAGDYTFRIEWQKSCGYEIIEQLFWNNPDYIICPIWGGTNLHAIYKWMKEFQSLWIIKKLPKVIWVQTPWCNPIYKAFKQKRRDFDIQENPSTVASAMAVWNPADWEKVLSDVYESKWLVVEVTDNEILLAQNIQAREEWIFAEPSWAMALATVKKLNAKKFFKASDIIVCIANWNWLKDPKAPLKMFAEPISIEPDFSEIERFVKEKLYDVWKENTNENKEKLLFNKIPNANELTKILERDFWIKSNKQIISSVTKEIQNFLTKWKEIKKADLLFILEEILDEIHLKNKVIEVTDFTIETSLHSKSKAEICAKAFWKDLCMKSSWVWPVDAAIKALKKWLKSHDKLEVKLSDYEVEIDSKWSDASVTVKMTLSDKNWNKVLARTTSPDIIVASIRAFEKWINILYSKSKISK